MNIIETFQCGMQPRAADLSRTNQEGDAVTRHGSCPRYVVAMWLRLSTHCAPIGSPASLSTLIPDVISDIANPWPRIRAPIAQQHFRNDHREQPGEHHARHPQLSHSPQIPISLGPHTAGSFSGGFRTPSGVRNSSRNRADRLVLEPAWLHHRKACPGQRRRSARCAHAPRATLGGMAPSGRRTSGWGCPQWEGGSAPDRNGPTLWTAPSH
jgi:hypothetical protein